MKSHGFNQCLDDSIASSFFDDLENENIRTAYSVEILIFNLFIVKDFLSGSEQMWLGSEAWESKTDVWKYKIWLYTTCGSTRSLDFTGSSPQIKNFLLLGFNAWESSETFNTRSLCFH